MDHGVGILASLSAIPEYAETAFPLLMEQLKKCPPKQLPMYAEKSLSAINTDNRQSFVDLLHSRMHELEKDTQRKRISKVSYNFV